MKNIRFYTIAMLFDRQLTPKVNRCLHIDIRYSTFDIGSHVIRLSWRIVATIEVIVDCTPPDGNFGPNNYTTTYNIMTGNESRRKIT